MVRLITAARVAQAIYLHSRRRLIDASARLSSQPAVSRSRRRTDVSRHISFGFFSTLVTLLAHSMMMFYLIGKGKAVKDAMAEGNLTGDYYRRIAAARKPVFSIGTLAMAVTMVAAISAAAWTPACCRRWSTRRSPTAPSSEPGRDQDRDRRPQRSPAASSTRSIACSARDARPSRSPASSRTTGASGRCASRA